MGSKAGMPVIFGASPSKNPFHPSTLPGLSLVWLLVASGGAKAAHHAASAAPAAEGTAPLAFATTAASPESCANATDDNQNGLIDEGCGLALGAVQFLAGWGAAKADVDLRVMEPYDWRLSEKNVWKVEQMLIDWPHRRIRTSDEKTDALRRRYRAFREAHGYKPWTYYRGRERWTPLLPEFRSRG